MFFAVTGLGWERKGPRWSWLPLLKLVFTASTAEEDRVGL
jgi:hypothetical protein